MTETELAALTKGQKLYSPLLAPESDRCKARVFEATYLGRTKAGLYRVRGTTQVYHEREMVVLESFYVTRREAATALVEEARDALRSAQAAYDAAVQELADDIAHPE